MGIAHHPNWGNLHRASKYIDGVLVQRYANSLDEAIQIEKDLVAQKAAAEQQALIERKPTKRGGSTPLKGIYYVPDSTTSRQALDYEGHKGDCPFRVLFAEGAAKDDPNWSRLTPAEFPPADEARRIVRKVPRDET